MTSKLDYSDVDGTKERIVGVFDVLGFRNALKAIGTNKLVRSYATAIGKAQAILQQTVDEVYMHVPAEYVEDEGFPGSSNSFVEPRLVQASLFPGVEEIAVFSDSIFGSGRESVKTFDLRGFSSCVQFDSRSRRRCGNVETRVLCGFPSSEGGQNRCGRRSIIPPSERHFHSEAPVYRPFWRECVVWAAGGAKICASQKAA